MTNKKYKTKRNKLKKSKNKSKSKLNYNKSKSNKSRMNKEHKLAIMYINKYDLVKAQKHLQNIQIIKNKNTLKNIKRK
tara:strand:- start:92 stop:325 length:234 start_codon:yes stop_codon:yes gene_type:complete